MCLMASPRPFLTLAVAVVCALAPLQAAELPTAEAVDSLITRSQAYLLAKQQPDGSFAEGGRFKLGGTALAVEALVSDPAGLPADQPAIQQALTYIAQYQQPDGGIYDPNEGLENYITSLSLMIWSQLGDAAEPKIDIEAAQNKLFGLQNTDEQDINYGGIGYGSKGPSHEDLNNTTFAVQALRQSGIPADHASLQRAMEFIQRCQNLSEVNDMGWAGTDGGGVYAPHQSKAGGSWSEEEQAQKAVEKAMETNSLASYGTMTYSLVSNYIILDLPKDDPRLQAALDWCKRHYQFERNPGMPEGQEQQGLLYYYQLMAKTFDQLDLDTVETEGAVQDWRADLFQALQDSAVEAEDGSVFWINGAERWGEGDPTIATPYIHKALKRIKASL
jgi:hypothetical protein